MTAQTAVMCQHATLTTTAEDRVTLSGTGTTLAICNGHATVDLYFRFDGGTAVVLADESYVVLPLQTKMVQVTGKPPVVSVIGNANPYHVELA